MRTLWMVVALAAGACGSSPNGPPCGVRSQRIEVALAVLSREQQVFTLDPGVKVVDLPNGNRPDTRGTSVVVTARGEVRMWGPSMGTDYEALNAQLVDELQQTWRSGTPVLYVVADAETTLGTLDEVLKAVPLAYEVRLAGYGTPFQLDIYQEQLREVASVKKFQAAADAEEPGQKAVYFARAMETAMGKNCAPLTAVFGGVAGEDIDKGNYLAREVPAALEKCGCNIKDADLVEYLLYSVFGAYERPHRWIPLAREHGPDMATVESLIQ